MQLLSYARLRLAAIAVNNVTGVAARTSVIATGSLSGQARVVVVSRSASARRRIDQTEEVGGA